MWAAVKGVRTSLEQFDGDYKAKYTQRRGGEATKMPPALEFNHRPTNQHTVTPVDHRLEPGQRLVRLVVLHERDGVCLKLVVGHIGRLPRRVATAIALVG